MFESIQQHENGDKSAVAVDIAPLIDVIFILLLFFLVTAVFTRETGIEVLKPEAFETEALEPESLRISLTASGAIYIEGKSLDLNQCREKVSSFLAEEKDGAVILIPDEEVSARQFVAVMDAAKQGGAGEIAIATRQKAQP